MKSAYLYLYPELADLPSGTLYIQILSSLRENLHRVGTVPLVKRVLLCYNRRDGTFVDIRREDVTIDGVFPEVLGIRHEYDLDFSGLDHFLRWNTVEDILITVPDTEIRTACFDSLQRVGGYEPFDLQR